uniref:Uncharacterized protein n=1 Tax=Arion vulgaris TaxID=1028688 RepID=A0A0B7B3W1_9EUPU
MFACLLHHRDTTRLIESSCIIKMCIFVIALLVFLFATFSYRRKISMEKFV